jgi:hypothetical protein
MNMMQYATMNVMSAKKNEKQSHTHLQVVTIVLATSVRFIGPHQHTLMMIALTAFATFAKQQEMYLFIHTATF